MIKSLFVAGIFLLSGMMLSAQQRDPVKWNFSLRRIDTTTIEVHMKAVMQDGWHIYSQAQPANSVAIPGKFTFKTDASFQTNGDVREVGKLIRWFDGRAGLAAHQYADSVLFIQQITILPGTFSQISGELIYQACSELVCLPPKTVAFSVKL